jgi:hypothetical protein
MFLIPYRWFWITSPLREDEVKRLISAHVDLTSPYDSFGIYDHKYGGTVTPKGFSLKRRWPNRSRITIQVEWHETGSRVGVMIAAPEFVGFLVLLPVTVAVATVQRGYLAGAAALAGSLLMCLAYSFHEGGLLKDLQQMLAGAPSL